MSTNRRRKNLSPNILCVAYMGLYAQTYFHRWPKYIFCPTAYSMHVNASRLARTTNNRVIKLISGAFEHSVLCVLEIYALENLVYYIAVYNKPVTVDFSCV